MEYNGRAFCLVERNNRVLMLKSNIPGRELCVPATGIRKGETPEQAALRALQEECAVSAVILKKLGTCLMPPSDAYFAYSFHVDIGTQTPVLGRDSELPEQEQGLKKLCWMALPEICERERVFLWALGLFNIPSFLDEFASWGDDISYPGKPEEKIPPRVGFMKGQISVPDDFDRMDAEEIIALFEEGQGSLTSCKDLNAFPSAPPSK